ncbi:hypothetical protein [Methylobacterium nigriterrae]
MSQANSTIDHDVDLERWSDRLQLSAVFLAVALAVEWLGVIVAAAW